MRTILNLLMFVCGALYMQAQNVEPRFEAEGDLVKATYFHDNGQVAQVGQLLKGKLHGEWIMYDAEGKKLAIGQYQHGIRTGKWFFWKGDLLQEVDFSDNRIVSVVQWINGEPIAVN